MPKIKGLHLSVFIFFFAIAIIVLPLVLAQTIVSIKPVPTYIIAGQSMTITVKPSSFGVKPDTYIEKAGVKIVSLDVLCNASKCYDEKTIIFSVPSDWKGNYNFSYTEYTSNVAQQTLKKEFTVAKEGAATVNASEAEKALENISHPSYAPAAAQGKQYACTFPHITVCETDCNPSCEGCKIETRKVTNGGCNPGEKEVDSYYLDVFTGQKADRREESLSAMDGYTCNEGNYMVIDFGRKFINSDICFFCNKWATCEKYWDYLTCAESSSQCSCPAGAGPSLATIDFPSDTSCQSGWPSHQGSLVIGGRIYNKEENIEEGYAYACDLFEVKDSQLLSIAQEGAKCLLTKCQDSSCHRGCDLALWASGMGSSANTLSISAGGFKRFMGFYMIYGLGYAKFMKGYFEAETNCYRWSGEDEESSCNPIDEGWNNNVKQLKCKFAKTAFSPPGWVSDSDMSKNSCEFSILPAHVNINILNTGTCADYSVSLTTLLRLAGYSKDEVLSVMAPCHMFNLVKFPGDIKWTIVDTVGNSLLIGNVYGTALRGDTDWPWECDGKFVNHCGYRLDGCSNDNGNVYCPQKSEVFGC